MRTVVVIVEKVSDGSFWCRSGEINGNTVINGCGDTVEEAKADLLECYEEAKADAKESGKVFEQVRFSFKYDLVSFFDYFSFLNVSEIAKKAGINPSLMRQYTSREKKAGDKTYARLGACIENIKKEFCAASF